MLISIVLDDFIRTARSPRLPLNHAVPTAALVPAGIALSGTFQLSGVRTAPTRELTLRDRHPRSVLPPTMTDRHRSPHAPYGDQHRVTGRPGAPTVDVGANHTRCGTASCPCHPPSGVVAKTSPGWSAQHSPRRSLPQAHQAVMEQGVTGRTGSSLRQVESLVTQLATHNTRRGGAQVGLTGSDLL
jgi:hypothetical protein